MSNGNVDPGQRFVAICDMIKNIPEKQRAEIEWKAPRLNLLRQKAENARLTSFERRCSAGQLAVADGRIGEARDMFLSVFSEFPQLYPHNIHFRTHILQLAICLQAFDVVAEFLNDINSAEKLFVVTPDDRLPPGECYWVTVSVDSKTCGLGINPSIVGHEFADHFMMRWASSAPLWVSYCRDGGKTGGSCRMNAGDFATLPGLAYCTNRPDFILVPDAAYLAAKGYAAVREKFALNWTEWDEREGRAFWRGATTGIRVSPDWRSLPRIALCEKSLERADILDAGISGIVQFRREDERQQVEAAGLLRDAVPPEKFLGYKYQIDIDGNSNSWPGFFQKLLTGSPVLKVASPRGYRQWYYDRLDPLVNYVPVNADMSDLFEKIEWLKSHDAEARAIGEQGRALAMSLDYESELLRSHERIEEALGRPAS